MIFLYYGKGSLIIFYVLRVFLVYANVLLSHYMWQQSGNVRIIRKLSAFSVSINHRLTATRTETVHIFAICTSYIEYLLIL